MENILDWGVYGVRFDDVGIIEPGQPGIIRQSSLNYYASSN
jgi:hypothetical protein